MPTPRHLIPTGLVPDRDERLELLGALGEAVEHGGLGIILERPLAPAALRRLARQDRDPLRATAALLFAHAGLPPPLFHLTEEMHAVHWAAEPDPLDGRPAPAGCALLPDGRPSVVVDARLARDLRLATPVLALLVGHAWRLERRLTRGDPLLDGPAGLAAAVYLGLGLVILNGDAQVVLPGDEEVAGDERPAIHFLGPPGISLAKAAWLVAAQCVFRGDEEGVEALPHVNRLAGPHLDEALRTALREAAEVVGMVGRVSRGLG